jgi:hypothetical protein
MLQGESETQYFSSIGHRRRCALAQSATASLIIEDMLSVFTLFLNSESVSSSILTVTSITPYTSNPQLTNSNAKNQKQEISNFSKIDTYPIKTQKKPKFTKHQ